MLGRFVTQLRVYRHILKHPLNVGEEWKATKRWLAWHVGARLVPGPVAVPFVNDTLLLVEPGMTGATLNVYCGLAEASDMAFVLHALRSDDLFLDVGANVGVYSLMASGAVGAQCIAIEPIATTVKKLKSNIALNELGDRIEVLNIAVGERVGLVRFTTMHDTMNHVAAENDRTNVCEVQQKSLDDILAGRTPHVMKIDIEGYELPAMKGATALLRDEDLMAILIELNGSGSRYGFSDRDVVELIQANGFVPVNYDPISRNLSEIPDALVKQGNNAIFVRDVDSMRERVRRAPTYRIGNRLSL